MSDSRLIRRLEVVGRRLHRVRRLKALCAAWLAAAAACLLLAGMGSGVNAWLAAGLLCGAVLMAWLATPRRQSDLHAAAVRIERRFPELNAALLTATAQQPDPETGLYGFLQEQVVSDALVHARRREWSRAVPARTLWGWRFATLACLAGFLAAAWFAWGPLDAASVAAALGGGLNGAGNATTIDVEPGDVELERGTSLLVLARFAGPLPADVRLVTLDADQQSLQIDLRKSLEDPVFGGRIPRVAADLVYHVEFDGQRSPDFRVTTFEYPALLRADADIQAPDYTGLPPEHLEDVRRISLIEGSTLLLTCRLNKPVPSATLSGDGGESHALTEQPGVPDEHLMGVTLRPQTSGRYELTLVDDDGRRNPESIEFRIEVIPNEPPELAVTFPSRDTQVSALEELNLEARAWDDFGIREHGIVFAAADGQEQSHILGESGPRGEDVHLAHLLALETLQARPRDLVSYYFYADDIGPDGRPRRTFSDMFFAEVRYFDEEYRQMPGSAPQQQPQQQSGQGSQAQKIAELQRQVVSATWNVIRGWPGGRIAPHEARFTEDVGVISESQAQVRTLTGDLAAELEDEAARQHAADAVRHMESAETGLARAAEDVTTDPLPAARTAEQSAYQALLRLQERIHVVQLQQQQQPSSSSSSSSGNLDRQLDQLELDNEQNRYEQERQAREQQQAQNREELQILNRLRELARRQEDLNERIKELEDRLRDAGDEEREELERELKRLQEDQQELLRDVDELRERMDRPENRREMAQSNQQLEQTRENIRNTTESLEQGQTSRALTSGARAQRELEEMRDDFRRRTAGDFADAMQQMREDARELAERERRLGEQFAEERQPEENGPPSLRDSQQRDDLADQLAEQRGRLGDLLDRMRDVVQQSEESEPLLSSRLYETMRETRVDQPEEALDAAEQLLRRGFPGESAAAEAQARQGIERLQAGVERAADSVLGDETEALRRAQEQLAQLTEAVRNELSQGAPDTPPGEEPGAAGEAGASPSESGARRNEPGGTPTQETPDDGRPSTDPREPQTDPSSGSRRQQDEEPGQSPAQTGSQSAQPSEDRAQPGEQRSQSPGPGTPGQAPGAGDENGAQPQTGTSPSEGDDVAGDATSRNPFAPFLPAEQSGNREGGGTSNGPHLPLTGEDFVDWSDRMRDVEEMLSDSGLRAEAGAIRERARDIRIEVRRHSEAPDWELVRTSVYGPMLELQRRLAEEIARRTQSDELVPIDRDPVPDRYAELVREYYERLSADERGAP